MGRDLPLTPIKSSETGESSFITNPHTPHGSSNPSPRQGKRVVPMLTADDDSDSDDGFPRAPRPASSVADPSYANETSQRLSVPSRSVISGNSESAMHNRSRNQAS